MGFDLHWLKPTGDTEDKDGTRTESDTLGHEEGYFQCCNSSMSGIRRELSAWVDIDMAVPAVYEWQLATEEARGEEEEKGAGSDESDDESVVGDSDASGDEGRGKRGMTTLRNVLSYNDGGVVDARVCALLADAARKVAKHAPEGDYYHDKMTQLAEFCEGAIKVGGFAVW